jgi:hypothetical protein
MRGEFYGLRAMRAKKYDLPLKPNASRFRSRYTKSSNATHAQPKKCNQNEDGLQELTSVHGTEPALRNRCGCLLLK